MTPAGTIHAWTAVAEHRSITCYRAECPCGWEGVTRFSEAEATHDRETHRCGWADTPAPAPPRAWRPCANCGDPTDGWWCSTQCRREEDGDERDHGDEDNT